MYLSQKGWARKSRPTKVDPRSKSLEEKVSKSTHCGRDNSGKGAERINTQGKMVVRVSSKTETMFYRAGDVCNAGTALELRTSTDGIATEPSDTLIVKCRAFADTSTETTQVKRDISDEVWVMGRLHLEGAVVRPQVDRIGDACASSFIDHLGRLGAGDIELHVGIFLPVSEEKRKLDEESIVGIAEGRKSLGARVAIQATLQCLTSLDEVLPVLEVIGIGFHLSIVLAHSRVLLLGAKLAEVAHDAEITCLSFLLCREVRLI